MLIGQSTHRVVVEEPIDERAAVEQIASDVISSGASEPRVDDVHGKPTLLAREDRARQEAPADLAMQPLTSSQTHLALCGNARCAFDHFAVEIRHSYLEAVRH